MKKAYTTPLSRVVHIDQQDLICESPFGPNSEGIPFEGEEGDEEIYNPNRVRGIWDGENMFVDNFIEGETFLN